MGYSKKLLSKLAEMCLKDSATGVSVIRNNLIFTLNFNRMKEICKDCGIILNTRGDILEFHNIWGSLNSKLGNEDNYKLYDIAMRLSKGTVSESEIGFSEFNFKFYSDCNLLDYSKNMFYLEMEVKGEFSYFTSLGVFGVITDIREYEPCFKTDDNMVKILECMNYKAYHDVDKSDGRHLLNEFYISGKIAFKKFKEKFQMSKPLDFKNLADALNYSYSEDRFGYDYLLSIIEDEVSQLDIDSEQVKGIESFKAKLGNSKDIENSFVEITVVAKLC